MASSAEKLASSWPSKPSSPELVDSTEAITAGHETTSGDASSATPTYRTYKRRWFGLMQLVLMNVAVSWDWLTYAPVATHAASYYSVSISAINWLSTAFFLSFVAVFPLAILTLHRGPKPALIAAAILLLLGNWIRYSGSHDPSRGLFPCAMAGEIVIGFAQPFVLAAPSRYSDLWFTDRGRVAATAVASLSNPLGAALAQLVNPLWVDDSPRHIPRMLLYVSLLSSACAVPSFFVPSHPPTPVGPSSTAPKLPLAASLRAAAGSLELWLVLVPFAVYVGLFNSLSSLLNQVLVPYGFSDDQAGIGGAILIVVGLVCAAAASPLLDRSKKLILATKVLVPLLAVAYLVFLWMPETGSVAGPYVVLALLGASSFILVPVAVELLVELSHPISPEITSAIAWAGGQLLGAVFIILSNALAGGPEAHPPRNLRRALILQAVVALAVAPLILSLGLFGRKDKIALRRLRLDQAGRESQLQTALATV